MKSVLISIQPKWVEKIANGEKTIEVRKTRPNLPTTFKCYIYCTINKRGEDVLLIDTNGENVQFGDYRNAFTCDADGKVYCNIGNGKVIGEFVCDKIYEFHEWQLTPSKEFYEVEQENLDLFLKESCLTYNEVCKYRKNLPYIKPLYAWHISDLKIYDKPKELREFRKYSEWLDMPITRPPQSWCYVEGEEYGTRKD